MKKIFLLLFLVFGFNACITNVEAASKTIYFEDAVLCNSNFNSSGLHDVAINNCHKDKSIYFYNSEDIELVTHLLLKPTYTSLKGIENFYNIEKITFDILYEPGTQTLNLKEIPKYDNLKYLAIGSYDYSVKVLNFDEISKFTSLEHLDITSDIKDMSALKNLTNLTFLDISNNAVEDLSFLETLVELDELRIYANNVSDISSIKNLIKLQRLTIDNGKVSDISALSNLNNLISLSLDNQNIKDLTPLSNLSNLEYLYLKDNNITDITALSNLTKLKILGLKKNNLFDITILPKLESLETLTMTNDNISDFSSLSLMKKLKNFQTEQCNIIISEGKKLVYDGKTCHTEFITISNEKVNDTNSEEVFDLFYIGYLLPIILPIIIIAILLCIFGVKIIREIRKEKIKKDETNKNI